MDCAIGTAVESNFWQTAPRYLTKGNQFARNDQAQPSIGQLQQSSQFTRKHLWRYVYDKAIRLSGYADVVEARTK
jgi:hypothetical protein